MKVKYVSDGLGPILLTCNLFALTPLTCKNRKFTINFWIKVASFLYLAFYTIAIYFTVNDKEQGKFHGNYASGVSKLGIISQMISHVALFYAIYLGNNCFDKRFLESLVNLAEIDRTFGEIGVAFDYRKHFLYEISVLFTGLSLIILRFFLNFSYINTHIVVINNFTYVIFIFPSLLSFLTQSMFAFLVRNVMDKFAVLNSQLLLLDKPIGVKVLWKNEFDNKNFLKKLQILMELHDRLTDVGNQINNAFTVQILCSFTVQFLAEVFTIFYFYYESLVLKDRLSSLNWLLWAVFTTVEILHVSIVCHLTSKQAKRTGIVIHTVLMDESDPQIRKKLMIFSQQVCHRPLEFSACGLFPIDATLIFTIAGAAATYLLIMLQFQEGIEAQCKRQ